MALVPPAWRDLPAGFRAWREGDALAIAQPARVRRSALGALVTIGAGLAAIAVARLALAATGVEELLAWAAVAALGAVTLRFVARTVELARPRVLRAGPGQLVVTRWWPWGQRRQTVATGAIRAITAAARGDDGLASAATPWEVRATLADGSTVTLLEADDQAAAHAVAAAVRHHLGRDSD